MRGFARSGRLVVLVVAALVLGGCDWTHVGFGPQGTNFNPYEPALTESSVRNLSVAWSTPCACPFDEPIVAAGVVYTIDGYVGDGPFALTVRAFNASNGAPKWSTPLGSGLSGATLAAVGNGLVYLTVSQSSTSGRLVAVDAQTGTPRWQVTPPAPASGVIELSRPIVDGQLAYVAATASNTTEVSAVDASGRVVWSAAPGGWLFAGSNLAADPGRTVYIATLLRITAPPSGFVLLTGYSEADGTVRSAVVVPTSYPLLSLASSGGILYGTGYTDFGRFPGLGAFALHPDTGVLLWNADLFELAVAPGAVITSDARRGTVNARNPSTGALLWTVADNASGVTVAGDVLFLRSGNVRRISDGALLTTLPAGRFTPSEGRVYAAVSGNLEALAPS